MLGRNFAAKGAQMWRRQMCWKTEVSRPDPIDKPTSCMGLYLTQVQLTSFQLFKCTSILQLEV